VRTADASDRGVVREVLADRNFVYFLAGAALWNIGLHGAGPFFNIYLSENLDASRLWIGALSALPAITGLGGLLYFGRAMDLRGTKWVMVFTGCIIPTLPAAWLFVGEPWHVIFLNAYGGVVWAGYNLAALNMLLVVSPRDRRPRYAAAYQTVVFAAAFTGPLIGGQIITHLGFKTLFVFSAVGRWLGTGVVARFVKEPASMAAAQSD
jgi:MFS family permease